MLNKLKGWIAPNTVTKDPNDKILILDPAGKIGLDKVYEEMRAEDLGTCSYPLRAGHRPPIDERIPREHRLILRRTPLHGLDRERALEP